jgi:hypothetical protein
MGLKKFTMERGIGQVTSVTCPWSETVDWKQPLFYFLKQKGVE